MAQEIQIISEEDPRNADVCRFTSTRTLYVGTRTIANLQETTELPLAQRLFGIGGIVRLQLIGHLLVVTKSSENEWAELTKEITSILTEYLLSGLALTTDQVQDQMMLLGRSTREKVQYLIDTHINPGIAEHGGFVRVVDLINDIVYLRMGGGCQGCGAADFTLRQGIETIIKRSVPEISQIIDVTNHSDGVNPYYKRPTQN
jgi:Fe-S cluster biogenesis protein NfuA